MIKIAGSIRRTFRFPATLPTALAYYSDLPYILKFLPHISIVKTLAQDHFRALYETTEFGGYKIQIFCDFQSVVDHDLSVIRILPGNGLNPIDEKAGINSSIAKGVFQSESLFMEEGEETEIDYFLQLNANLPTPIGLRLLPDRVHNTIAKNITGYRMREIADGFIQSSIEGFARWQTNRQNPSENVIATGLSGGS